MAPTPMIKICTTKTSETKSCNGQLSLRKRIVEQVEEDEEYDGVLDNVDVDGDAEELGSSEQSSGVESGDMLAEAMFVVLEKQRKRRDMQQKRIENEYAKSKMDTEEGITTVFDEYEAEASSAHDSQISTLRGMLAKKAKLEMQMAIKREQLQDSYRAHCHDLERVAELRAKALH